ncbi:MAG: hypothetical protein JXN60_04800 [Lentisphaerae bacterium]|nr:hypothetical protein [Lentisphaerota bacterium]
MVVNKRIGIFFLLLELVIAGASVSEARQDTTLLVVPSKYTIVQLAFDMAKIRNVDLVAYDSGVNTVDPILHVWNDTLQEWTRTTLQEYETGNIFRSRPGNAVIIGSASDLPAGLLDASKWISDRTHVPTLNIVTLINTLNSTFSFSKKEWKWLGKRYRLELKDLNKEQRRYGRYGRPAGDRAKPEDIVPVPTVETVNPVIINVAPTIAEEEIEPDLLPTQRPKELKNMKPTGRPMKATQDSDSVLPEDK